MDSSSCRTKKPFFCIILAAALLQTAGAKVEFITIA